MTMLQHALKAQARGLHIFPVAAGDKVPHRLAGYRDQAGGFHGWGETATNDISKIAQFWTQVDPAANIGVACKPSELLVIDLDKAKKDWNLRGTEWAYMHDAYGPRVSGEDLWDEMIYQNGGTDAAGAASASATYTVRTGSGGTHLYYRWPAHWPRISQASPVKGVVDVRGNGGQHGGYVLAAGSVTDAGPYYELWTGHQPGLPPEWIRTLVVERPQPTRVQRPRQPHMAVAGLFSWDGLAHTVRNAGEGNRNNALLWAARSMCTDGASEQECKDALGPAAQEAGLGWYEIERTIESAYRVQRQKEGL